MCVGDDMPLGEEMVLMRPFEWYQSRPLLRTSSAKQKRMGLRGSPCLTPLLQEK